MGGTKVIEEIAALLREDSIDPNTALRLILASQMATTKSLSEIQDSVTRFRKTSEERMKEFEDTVEEQLGDLTIRVVSLETYRTYYPSLVWLWVSKKRTFIAVVLILMLLYTILFGWLNIDDIRHAVFDQLGLPYDLGLGPP